MATKINIAQLDIDIDGLKGSMVEAKRELDRLVESNREMRKAGDSANETYIEQDAAIKRLRAEYNSQARVLNQTIVAIEGADEAYNKQIKTVAQAEAANKTLRQAVKHLDTTTLEGLATAELYNNRIEENTAFMKDNVDEQIQGYMSVGEYSKGIQDAAKELSPFNMLLKGMNGGFKEAGGVLPFVTQSLKGVVGGIRAATASSLAFIATPVGAVIAAIGLALGLVINYLKNTESGMDKVMSVLTPLNEILKVFWELLENVGKALVDAFSNPGESVKALGNLIGKVLVGYVKTAMRYFTNLGKIMLGAVTFDKSMIKEGWDDMKALAEETKDAIVDGFDKAKGAVDKFGNSLSEAAENGREIRRLTIAIRESTEELAASENDYKNALLEQEAIYKDRSKSEEERLAAAEAMKKLQEERSIQIQDQLTMEIERHRREIAAGETTHEQRMQLIALEKKLGDEKRKTAEIEVQQLSRINNIRERGERDRQKALQAQKKLQEEILRLKESQAAIGEAEDKVAEFYRKRLAESNRKIAEDESISFKKREEAYKKWYESEKGKIDLDEANYNRIKKEAEEKKRQLDSQIEGQEELKKVNKSLFEDAKRHNEELEEESKNSLLALDKLKKVLDDREEGRSKKIREDLAREFLHSVEQREEINKLIEEEKKLIENPLITEKQAEEASKRIKEFQKIKDEPYWSDEQRAELEASLAEELDIREKLEVTLDKHRKRLEDIKIAKEANSKSEEEYRQELEKTEETLTGLNNQVAGLTLQEIDFTSVRDSFDELSKDLSSTIKEDNEENQRFLKESADAMADEITLLQQETELERLVYERELRAKEMKRELDEEEAFLIEKMELLNSTEEERTALLENHAILRREVMAELEEQWREEDKQHVEDYEAYKRDMARETTDLVLDQIGRESTAGKILSAFKKGLALQEWVIQKKKAAADMALAKASATGELAKGQAKTASSAPFPLNIPLILGFVAQAAGILSMFKQPKVKDPKFARGTILGGSRHFEGGVKTPFGEVEGGEMLLTRGVTFNPLLRSMASQLNMMGGGDRLDTGSSVGSIGSPKGFIDYDTLAAKVAQANRHLPSPLVRVSDIDRVQDSVKVIDDLTSF